PLVTRRNPSSPHMNVALIDQNVGLVNYHIRHYIKLTHKLETAIEWSLLRNSPNDANTPIGVTHEMDWQITWALFKSVSGFNCVSFAHSNKLAWYFSCVNQLQPDFPHQARAYPQLYNDHTIKCSFCNNRLDEWTHLSECSHLTNTW